MLTNGLVLWIVFFIGAAALIPGVAALLRRITKTVHFQSSVSIEGSPEQIVEMLRESPPSEAVVEVQKLITALETNALEESRVVNNLIGNLLEEAERTRQRDLLLAMLGWLVSALCGMFLTIYRSELSLLLACIWLAIFIPLLSWKAWEWTRKRFEVDNTKVEQREQNFVE